MKGWIQFGYLISVVALAACSSSENQTESIEKEEKISIFQTESKADVLPYLNIQQQAAKLALPFCETKNCIDIDVQTLHTADPWLNDWIERQQALVIQDQIGLKQNMLLQDAVSAYVKKSDAWQAAETGNLAYTLSLYSRVPYQRNQYVLLQVGADTKQEEREIKERYYFFVADRKAQKTLKMLDIIDSKKQITMDKIVQAAYQKWLEEQSEDVKTSAPKKLYWGQADWFFDHDGLGLHYRDGEIAKNSPSCDLYLNLEQTQQVTKPEIYQAMF